MFTFTLHRMADVPSLACTTVLSRAGWDHPPVLLAPCTTLSAHFRTVKSRGRYLHSRGGLVVAPTPTPTPRADQNCPHRILVPDKQPSEPRRCVSSVLSRGVTVSCSAYTGFGRLFVWNKDAEMRVLFESVSGGGPTILRVVSSTTTICLCCLDSRRNVCGRVQYDAM